MSNAAVDDDVEREARAGPEFEQADAATGAVAERDQANAGDLVEPADAAKQLGPSELATEQLRHDVPRSVPRFVALRTPRPVRRECPGRNFEWSARSAHHSPFRDSTSSGVAGRSEAPSAAACIQSV